MQSGTTALHGDPVEANFRQPRRTRPEVMFRPANWQGTQVIAPWCYAPNRMLDPARTDGPTQEQTTKYRAGLRLLRYPPSTGLSSTCHTSVTRARNDAAEALR